MSTIFRPLHQANYIGPAPRVQKAPDIRSLYWKELIKNEKKTHKHKEIPGK